MPAKKKTESTPQIGEVGGHIRRLQAERGLYVSGTWGHKDAETTLTGTKPAKEEDE